MAPPSEYQGIPFKPTLSYKIDFGLKKKAPIHTLVVEYGKVVEVKDQAAQGRFVCMQQVMQYKETV